jgi:hypothetical protein
VSRSRSRPVAVEHIRIEQVAPRRVADPIRNLIARRSRTAKLLQPDRRARATARHVHHQVGVQHLRGGAIRSGQQTVQVVGLRYASAMLAAGGQAAEVLRSEVGFAAHRPRGRDLGRRGNVSDEMQAAAPALRTATTPGSVEIADLLEVTARDLVRQPSLSRKDWLRSIGATTVTHLASQSRYGLAG